MSGQHLLRAHQRRARHLQDRGRPDRDPPRAVRPARGRSEGPPNRHAAGREEGPAGWSRGWTPDVGRITSDRRRVEQILLNLLSNAHQVHRERRGAASECRRDDGRVAIRVTDTGIGITSRGSGPAVPAVPSARHRPDAPVRRHGAGAGHLQAPGRAAGRHRSRSRASGARGARFSFTLPVPYAKGGLP